jgi:hypothetical protein
MYFVNKVSGSINHVSQAEFFVRKICSYLYIEGSIRYINGSSYFVVVEANFFTIKRDEL